jgi:tetratricopeptide (TPR) repeat protein
MEAAEAEVPETIEMIEEPETIEPLPEELPEALPESPPEVPEPPELLMPDLELENPPLIEDLEIPEEAEEITFEEPAEAPPAPAAGAPGAEPAVEQAVPERGTAAEADAGELWAEAEFYYQQGLFDEARKQYERILEFRPNDRKAMERIVAIAREKEDTEELARLAEAVEGLEQLVDAGPTVEETVTRSDVESVRSLMQEITDLRKGKPAAPPPEATEPPAEESFADISAELSRRAPQAAEASEESFAGLAEELRQLAPETAKDASEAADFFDLAAELRDELSTSPSQAAPPALHEQSIDEIFEEFKKGVEAHEKKEDEDTHYNLGVAYREMGLLDDAISEFNMTNEGEPKFIQSRYMLGLCYLEKEDYETAILEIQNALGYSYSFGEASEERTGMHYDLGLAYRGIGNTQAALEELQKVYSLDPTYREVSSKIRELQEGEFISLESIKEDIEKEISFKFLEEGARIEREEKTKPKKSKK